MLFKWIVNKTLSTFDDDDDDDDDDDGDDDDDDGDDAPYKPQNKQSSSCFVISTFLDWSWHLQILKIGLWTILRFAIKQWIFASNIYLLEFDQIWQN